MPLSKNNNLFVQKNKLAFLDFKFEKVSKNM